MKKILLYIAIVLSISISLFNGCTSEDDKIDYYIADTTLGIWSQKFNKQIFDYTGSTDTIIIGSDSFPIWSIKVNSFIDSVPKTKGDTIIYGVDDFEDWRNRFNTSVDSMYNALADSLFNRMALPPDNNRKLLISKTIDSLQGSNLWDKCDVRYFLNAHDVQASIIDWKSDTLRIIPFREPTFTIDSGWRSDGIFSYLNTSYNMVSSALNYTLSDASFSVFTQDQGDENNVIFGARDGSSRNQINNNQTDGSNVYIHNGVVKVVASGSVTDTSGLYTSTINGTAHDIYLNSVLQSTEPSVSPIGFPDLDNYLLAYNLADAIASPTIAEMSYFDACASLTPTEATDLYDIVDYYNSNLQSSATKYVDLITFDGQSNQYGIGMNDSLKFIATSVEVWDSTTNRLTWIDGKTGINNQPINAIKMNPLYSTGLSYDSLPSKVFTSLYAISGSQLYEDATILDWNANSVGEYLDSYLNFIDSTIKYMSERNIEVRTLYRVKFQGETDADDLTKANAFEANETAVIEKYNTRFSGETVSHILIEITDSRTYSSTINAALNSIATARSDTQIINNDNFVYTDGTHLDLTSHLWLGRKLFELTYKQLR